MLITILLSIPIFMGIGLIVAGFFERQHDATELANMSKRLNQVATRSTAGGFTNAQDLRTQEVDKEFARQEEKRLRMQRKTTYLPSLSKFSENSTFMTRLDDELMQVRSHWRATELMAGAFMLAVVAFVVALVLGAGLFSLLVIVPVFFLPRIYVKTLRAMYFRRFDDQLGDALMLMSNSLRAGFSFMQALEMIGREAPPPISEEFARVTQEIQVGVPIPEALNGMSQRIESMDLRLVVTAVIIQREVGGALAQLLELISGVIRERQRIKGEIRTLTAQGRLTGAILGAMPITVGCLIYLVSRAANGPNEPTFIDPLIHETLGQMLLATAVLWQFIGFWLIWKIVSIKV